MKKSNIVQIPQPTPQNGIRASTTNSNTPDPPNWKLYKPTMKSSQKLIKYPGIYKETKWELKDIYMEYKYYHETKNMYQLDKIIDHIGQVEYKYIQLLKQKHNK